MKSLLPYMDPQVTTFDQPKVQQQMYNGTAAIAIMFSGRMNDLTLETNSQVLRQVRLRRAAGGRGAGGALFSRLSIDGWSIPANTKLDPDLLFEMIASSVSEDASKAAVPAAYPARKGAGDAGQLPVRRRLRSSRSPRPQPPVARRPTTPDVIQRRHLPGRADDHRASSRSRRARRRCRPPPRR